MLQAVLMWTADSRCRGGYPHPKKVVRPPPTISVSGPIFGLFYEGKVIADEDEVVGGGRAHILGDPPPLKVFLVLGMGLPDSFRKYRFLVREIKNTIIRYTMSGWMNTFSVLVIVEDVP
jgi:hypothetical protein